MKNKDLENLLYSFEKDLGSLEGKELLLKYVVDNGGKSSGWDAGSDAGPLIVGNVHKASFRYFFEEGWCGVIRTIQRDVDGAPVTRTWNEALACYNFLDFKEAVLKVSEMKDE